MLFHIGKADGSGYNSSSLVAAGSAISAVATFTGVPCWSQWHGVFISEVSNCTPFSIP